MYIGLTNYISEHRTQVMDTSSWGVIPAHFNEGESFGQAFARNLERGECNPRWCPHCNPHPPDFHGECSDLQCKVCTIGPKKRGTVSFDIVNAIHSLPRYLVSICSLTAAPVDAMTILVLFSTML